MTTTAHTPRRVAPLAVIPDGYYAVPDPDQPDTMTYWRSRYADHAFTAWPAKATYGPLAYRKDRPKDHAAAVDWMRAHNERRRAWHERVLAAIGDDPATAAARFAELTTRCLCCGRKLTDAKSKLLGIGPDCRRSARLDDAVLCAHVTPRIAAAHAAHLADAAASSGSDAGAREDGAK